MIRICSRCARKGNKGLENIIEITRKRMVEEFGLDLEIVINNEMGYRGRLELVKIENGEVEKFGKIEIKTTETTYGNLIETIVHEFNHINYPNCHGSKKDEIVGENLKHTQATRSLFQRVIKEFKEKGIIC